MKKILIASANEKIKRAIEHTQKKYSAIFDFDFCVSTEEVLRNIYYELPEIKIIDFSSPQIRWSNILHAIGEDPWLYNGGIIAIAKNNSQVQQIENLKNSNIVIVQTRRHFVENFPRLLRILLQNQQFLYSRGMQDSFGENESWSFVSKNNAFDIQVYTNFLLNYLYSSNYIDLDSRYKLQTVLMELLFNALEHGNCGIDYEEKTQWLEKGNDILDLIAERNKDPNIAKKNIYITYTLQKNSSEFTIRDDGEGFDWKKRLNEKAKVGRHGMGVKISQSFVKNLRYNEKGNEVSFSLPSTQNQVNTVPLLISSYSAIEYKDKEVVCKQNETSNNLFFIVSGKYAVYVNRKLVSVLTPKDMFIGEMSFLLNDRRSAAILSVGKGRLIKIPKSGFINLIRKNPHYAIFLSRLLAQRLYRQTQINIMLQKN